MAPPDRRMLVTYEPAAGGEAVSATARDAALGGLFIETKRPLAVGALLSVELRSASNGLTLEARVFSTQADGMAVRFLDLPAGALGTLQAILNHHRPPLRTQLGVGDAKDALVASAGGRDEFDPTAAEQDDALALAAMLEVDGRPTVEHLPHATRYPTPRMVPVTRPPAPAGTLRMPAPGQSPAPPAMPVLPPRPAPRTTSKVAAVLVGVAVVLIVAAVGALFTMR